jgi:hypothetical protein
VRLTLLRVLEGAALGAPFVVLGVAYGNLPNEFPVLRAWDQRPILWAEKSPLTVFRVPAIGVLTAMAAELMRRHAETTPGLADRKPLARLWGILLITACVKSLFEGLDLATAAGAERAGIGWLGGAALATIAAGLALTATQLPRAWAAMKQPDNWRLTRAERWTFACLALAYIVCAAVPLMLAGRSGD